MTTKSFLWPVMECVAVLFPGWRVVNVLIGDIGLSESIQSHSDSHTCNVDFEMTVIGLSYGGSNDAFCESLQIKSDALIKSLNTNVFGCPCLLP